MVAATYTSDLTDIYLFESTTNVSAWNITGGSGSGLGAGQDYAIEGTNAVDKQVSASEKGFMYNLMSVTIGPNDHFFIWVTVAVYGGVAIRDSRGIAVAIGDDTTNYVQYHVNGSDTLPAGGIFPYAIRHNNVGLDTRRTVTGSPGVAPDHIGATANVTITAKFSNLACDAARVGTGYTILGGTGANDPANLSGIATDDEGTAEGVFQTASGGFKMQGKLRLGQSGTEGELTDINTNIFLIENLDGHTLSDFSEIVISDDLSILTLTNVNIIALGTGNPGRLEVVTPLVTAQDETSYDNSPTSEGTFSGGTGHAASDVITLDDGWTTVTVDAVSGGVVTQFTVGSLFGRSAVAGTAMTQQSTTGSGASFSLTPDTDNIVAAGTVPLSNVGFIDFGNTVAGLNDSYTDCRWIGCDQVIANSADFNGSSFEGYRQVIIDAQDETSYDDSPPIEGTFTGGTGHAASDILTLSDGTLITVDAVSGGVVTQFTVDSSASRPSTMSVALTQLSSDGSGVNFTLTPDSENFASSAYMVWGTDDPNGELDNTTFTRGINPTHAIEFPVGIATSITLTDVTFVGYNGLEDAKDTALWFRDTSGTITVNISGGTEPTFKSDGADIVINAGVTVSITVTDSDGGAVEGARVRIELDSDGSEVAQGETNASGIFSDSSFSYVSDTAVLIKVRLRGFKPFRTAGTILSTGLSAGVTLQNDVIVDLP